VEVRVGPSEIRSPFRFNLGNTGSSQTSRAAPISGDDVTTTSGKASMTSSRGLEETESTCRGVLVVMSESFGGGLPMDQSSVEATSRSTVSQTNEMIAHSSVFTVEGVGQMSSSPSDGFIARSGVLEASRAVTAGRSGGRGRVVSASGGIGGVGNVGSAHITSSGRNVIPGAGSTLTSLDVFTGNLTVNVDLSTRAEDTDDAGVG
jgi:hypothetical protein